MINRLVPLQLPSRSFPELSRGTIPKTDLINLERIGEGSRAVVFKAQWQGQQVVYKEIKPLTGNEGEEKKAFVREFDSWKYDLSPSAFFFIFYKNLIFLGMQLTSPVCHCMA